MAPKSDSTEGIVLNFVNERNMPLNSQNVADASQKYNLKKTAVKKALDALADSGQISFKEYGKQKIYIARQDQFKIPNPEELDQMKKENAKLQEELQDQKKAIQEIETEIRALQSNMTMEEIHGKETKLQTEVSEMEGKLKKLRSGVVLVKPEDKKAIQEAYSEKINQGRKRKRMFKELWDAITENSPKDLKEFKVSEDMLEVADPRVEVPALLIMGEKDYCLKFPGIEDYIRSGMVKYFVPKLEEVIFIPEGTHFVHDQLPDQVNHLIVALLNDHVSS